MSLLNEYYDQREQEPTDAAKKIAFAVLDNLTGRKGFDNAWDDVDHDIQEELLADLIETVRKHLP